MKKEFLLSQNLSSHKSTLCQFLFLCQTLILWIQSPSLSGCKLFDTLIVLFKDLFKKVNFEKIKKSTDENKSMKN